METNTTREVAESARTHGEAISARLAAPVGGSGSRRFDLPGGGQVNVGPNGASVDLPGGGRVSVGSGGASVDVPGVGSVSVGSDGKVTLPDGTEFNPPREDWLPGGGANPPGGSTPGPFPNVGTTSIPISIPIPKLEAEPFVIPIPVPRFSTTPLEIPLAIPSFTAAVGDVAATMGRLMAAHMSVIEHMRGLSLAGQGAAPQVASFPAVLPSTEKPARWTAEIKVAVARAVDAWKLGSTVSGGTIQAGVGILAPGALHSDSDFHAVLAAELAARGVPAKLAQPVADVLSRAWTEWFAGYGTVLTYPTFAAYPGPVAPPTPNMPSPLAIGSSRGWPQLLQLALGDALHGAIPRSGRGAEVERAIQQFSAWFSTRFVAFCGSTQMCSVMGSGPVPSFAPPYVPVGPVLGGTMTSPRGVLIGPNPFDVP